MFSKSRVVPALMAAAAVSVLAPEPVKAGSASSFPTPYGIAVEADGNWVATDTVAQGVERISPESGVTTLISSATIGSGPLLITPYGIDVEAGGDIVITDDGLDAVVRVDPVSGDRVIVSDATTGTGPLFGLPFSIAIEADGNLLVADFSTGVVRVDPVSGDRTIVSDATTGSGPAFAVLFGIAVEADGNIVVTSAGTPSVIRVDPVTGDRTTVSDATTGTGPTFLFPLGIEVEADGNLVVADNDLPAVIRVDPVTGDRTIVSDSTTGVGPAFSGPLNIAVQADGDLPMTDQDLGEVFLIDALTGDRSFPGLVQEILGKSMLVKNQSYDVTKRRLHLTAKEKNSANTIVGDPVLDGAIVNVIVNGDNPTAQTFVLLQGTSENGKAFWSYTKNGFKYTDKKGEQGAVKELIVEQNDGTFEIGLKAIGKNGPIDVVPADLTREGGMVLSLGGGVIYCVLFGEDSKQSENPKRWRAKDPATEGCPVADPLPLPLLDPPPVAGPPPGGGLVLTQETRELPRR